VLEGLVLASGFELEQEKRRGRRRAAVSFVVNALNDIESLY